MSEANISENETLYHEFQRLEEIFNDFQQEDLLDPGNSSKKRKRDETETTDAAAEEEDTEIEILRAENERLKKKLRFLSEPSGGTKYKIAESEGPSLQVMYYNHLMCRRFRNDIEKFVQDCLLESTQRDEVEKFFVPDVQMSAVRWPSVTPGEQEDLLVSGIVQYYTNYCVDKLGMTLVDSNPSLTESWEVPKFEQVCRDPLIGATTDPNSRVIPKPRFQCFNCDGDHTLRDCTQPRDFVKISLNRSLHGSKQRHNVSKSRYHDSSFDNENSGNFVPGKISSELREALGIEDRQLPPYIYMMRQHGYPPGWLKEATVPASGLAVYIQESEEGGEGNCVISYNADKIVNFPGFNSGMPGDIKDDYNVYNVLPLQPSQSRDTMLNELQNSGMLSTKKSNIEVHPVDDGDEEYDPCDPFIGGEGSGGVVCSTPLPGPRLPLRQGFGDLKTAGCPSFGNDSSCIIVNVPVTKEDTIMVLDSVDERDLAEVTDVMDITDPLLSRPIQYNYDLTQRDWWLEAGLSSVRHTNRSNAPTDLEDGEFEETSGDDRPNAPYVPGPPESNLLDTAAISTQLKLPHKLDTDWLQLSKQHSLPLLEVIALCNLQNLDDEFESVKGLPSLSRFAEGIQPHDEGPLQRNLGIYRKIRHILKGVRLRGLPL